MLDLKGCNSKAHRTSSRDVDSDSRNARNMTCLRMLSLRIDRSMLDIELIQYGLVCHSVAGPSRASHGMSDLRHSEALRVTARSGMMADTV